MRRSRLLIVLVGLFCATGVCVLIVAHWRRVSQGERGTEHAPVVAMIRLPADALAEAGAQKVDERRPVTETILGTHVTGMSDVKGHVTIHPESAEDGAAFEIVLTGTSTSNTSGRNGPVEIDSHTVQRFTATKRVTLDADGLHAQPARVEVRVVQSSSTPETDAPGLRGRVITGVAERRIAATHEQADAITEQNTRRRVAEGFDQAVAARLKQINQRPIFRQLLGPASSDKLGLRLTFSSTDEALTILIVAGDGPPVTVPADLHAATSEPAVFVNYAEAAAHLPEVLKTLDRLRDVTKRQASLARHERAAERGMIEQMKWLSMSDDGHWAIVPLGKLPTVDSGS